ncbi:MAG: DUF4234 domain-containing protein [Clostridiales bacterium]|nr:DUF4234 domain-containing protein [Clostridiales bacterium]
MKRRNIVLCIVFDIITFGIYGIYWFVVMTNEMNSRSKHPHQTSGGVSFLLTLITLGIYGWFWAWKMGEKSDILKNRYLEYTSTDTRVLYLVLGILGLQIVNYCLIQYELNRAYDLDNGTDPEQWKPIN